MSTSVRGLVRLEAEQAVAVLGQLRLDLLKLRAGSIFHADTTTAVSVANATADGYGVSSSALVNAEVTAYHAHLASVCSATSGVGCHLSADSTNTVSAAVATDVASAITRANELKADFNAHIGSAVFHPVADSTNTVSASDASDEASLVTLVNQIKTKMNAHFAAGFAHPAIIVVAP